MFSTDYLLVDLRYAMNQLRKHADIERAMDALERVEECLLQTAVVSDYPGDEWADLGGEG